MGWVLVRAGDQQAWELLARAVREVLPVASKRQWRVCEVSELPPQRQKKRLSCEAVLGTHHIGTGRIGVAVRDPQTRFRLAPYDADMANLLHELAHFEQADHGAAFYRVVGSILEELAHGEGGSARHTRLGEHIARDELFSTPKRWRNFRPLLLPLEVPCKGKCCKPLA